MKQLDMTPYHPYKEMGKSCHLREIMDKKVVWPWIDYMVPDNSHLKLRVITRKDIDAVAELWRSSYPEVYGSVHEWILHPEEYEGRVAFGEDWAQHSVSRLHAIMVGEDLQTGKIALSSIYTKWDQNLQIEASFFAIHPDYRKGKISSRIWSSLASIYQWFEDSGAEYVTVFCETWQNITQYIWFKRFGWKIAGIFPGSYTRWARDKKEYRGCTVHFYRFLNNGEKYSTAPEEWELLPEIRELWNFLEKINQNSSQQ